MSIIEKLKTNPKSKGEINQVNRPKNRTRISIMEEIALSTNQDAESEGTGSLVLVTKTPPRLFVLPNGEELDELLEKAIILQIAGRVAAQALIMSRALLTSARMRTPMTN